MAQSYTRIILPARPQPDTIIGIFLLQTFGKEKYPGVEEAKVEVLAVLPPGEDIDSLFQKGTILLDIGKGKFDHHAQGKTATRLIAEDLDIANKLALAKLLAYAERDDKYGAGTISKDPLDRAFGLSGLIAALNRTIPQNPDEVVKYILPLLAAHYLEEKKRTEDLPLAFAEKLEKGEVYEFQVKHKGKTIRVIALESDDPSMAGWLKSKNGRRADAVVQKTSSGHVNIITNQIKKIDLRWTALSLRKEEAGMRKRSINLSTTDFMRQGRIQEVSEWYYDRATNSLLNGGILPEGISPTLIPLQKIIDLTKEGLSAKI